MKEKKIFIACPITKYLDSDLLIHPEYEEFIKSIFSTCKAYTSRVFLALEREKYGKALMEGPECTLYDYREMIDSDIVIALPEDSLGVAIELGWASAMRKDIFLILDQTFTYSPLVQCLNVITPAAVLQVPSRKTNSGKTKDLIVKELRKFLSLRCFENPEPLEANRK